jgi:hypothetical protein
LPDVEAKIVKISEVKKTPEEREAQRLLGQLGADTAIEVVLSASDSLRRVTSMFRRAAKASEKQIRIRHREDKLYVTLTQR